MSLKINEWIKVVVNFTLNKHTLLTWLYHDGIKLIKHKHSAQWHQKFKSLKYKQNFNELSLHYYATDYKLTWMNESSAFQKLASCLAFWYFVIILSTDILLSSVKEVNSWDVLILVLCWSTRFFVASVAAAISSKWSLMYPSLLYEQVVGPISLCWLTIHTFSLQSLILPSWLFLSSLRLLILSLTLLSLSPFMSLELLFLNTMLPESSSVLWWQHFLEQEFYTMILLWRKIHQN